MHVQQQFCTQNTNFRLHFRNIFYLPNTASIEGMPVDISNWLLCKEGRVPGITTALPRAVFFLKLVAILDFCYLIWITAGLEYSKIARSDTGSPQFS